MKTFTAANPAHQQGVMMLATLLILLVITLLGMSTVDSSGIQMKMSSNSRQQQQVFEAAEYVLSWAELNTKDNGFYTDTQHSNGVVNGPCSANCFTSACTNGLCFFGTAANVNNVTAAPYCDVGSTDPSLDSTIWATGSGKYKTLTVPYAGLVAKYIIEYRCFTEKVAGSPKYSAGPPVVNNYTYMYRITTLVASEDGRARSMLRSTIKKLP